MKKIVVVLLASLLVLVGCGSNKAVEKTDITIKHDRGETELKTNPEKVIIFDLGILDMYKELGLTVGGVPKSNLSDNLKEFEDEKYLNAGTLFEPLFEEIAEYGPDLIIISGRAENNYDELNKIAPTISLNTVNGDFMGSVTRRLETLKALYPETANKIDGELKEITDGVAELKAKASESDKQTLFLLANGDTISIYGPGSRFGMIYDDFGFTALEGVTYDESTHGQQISFEFIGEHNPDMIIVMDRVAATGQEGTAAQDLLNNDLVNKTNAVKNDEVIYVNPFVWYLETGGLNATKVMIQELTELVK